MPVSTMVSMSMASPLRPRTGLASGKLPGDGPQHIATLCLVWRSNSAVMGIKATFSMPVARSLMSPAFAGAAAIRPGHKAAAQAVEISWCLRLFWG
jgi:hypothetical protein